MTDVLAAVLMQRVSERLLGTLGEGQCKLGLHDVHLSPGPASLSSTLLISGHQARRIRAQDISDVLSVDRGNALSGRLSAHGVHS